MKQTVSKPTVSKPYELQQGKSLHALTISISLPPEVQVDEQSAKELLVLALVESGHLSQSQAAQVLNISRYDLLELMGKHGIPLLRLSPQERQQEEQHLCELHALRQEGTAVTQGEITPPIAKQQEPEKGTVLSRVAKQ